MSYAYAPGAGHRKIDDRMAATEQLAAKFSGLPADVGHLQVLNMLKRAAQYIGVKPRLVQVIDTLFRWTRAIDWTVGQRPIVFPSNEVLGNELGIDKRQLQKTLAEMYACGLLAHRDSPNGKRCGKRGKDERLIYAYGIDLSPLGVRYQEMVEAYDRGIAANERIDVLRKRLSAARRRIRSFAQLVEDEGIGGIDAKTAVEISQMATQQMADVRDEALLSACVEQLEGHQDAIGKAVAAAFESRQTDPFSSNSSPSDEYEDAHITTTNQPETAKAAYSSGYSERSSKPRYDVRNEQPQTEVEADLAKHGVDPAFIAAAVPELILSETPRPSWGELIGTAERLVDQASIHRNVWHEACRLMGQKGAAASVIATAHKHSRGEVQRPGAYLRGMNKHAASGLLNLGRTFHGLKDSARAEGMRSLAVGSDPRSIGQLAAAALGLARGKLPGARLL